LPPEGAAGCSSAGQATIRRRSGFALDVRRIAVWKNGRMHSVLSLEMRLCAEGAARQLDFRILGSLEVRADGRPIEIAAAKQRAVLTVLLLHANAVVSSDRLIDDIWGARARNGLKHALQVYVSELRKAAACVADVLVTRAPGYMLQVEPGELDRDRFERLVAEGGEALASGHPELASERLRGALSLWRGPALADFAYEPFAQTEIARLEELRLQALESRVEAELALGRHGDLVAELEALVGEHPLRERAREQLMLALYRSGRQAEALEAYRNGRRLLVEEVGIEPSPALQLLERRILVQDETLAAPAARSTPAPRAPVAHPTNVQLPPTRFIGRARELAELRGLLLHDDVRLLSLTGAGGGGKTRLAVQLAADLGESFPSGVVFVTLEAISDPSLVAATIALTLAVAERADRTVVDSLIEHLAEKQLLLVLDNFEQVLDAATDVARLVSAVPGLKVLVTSRVRLRLTAEHEYEVLPLSQCDASLLFLERARAAHAGLCATPADAAAIAEICARLDCLPLAVELAAARVRLLSPQAIVERLERRLPLLTDGPRDLPARQRTLRATIDWSYRLLDVRDRRLFARLAVFAGGFTLEAAERVCQTDLDAIASLAEKSLLYRRERSRSEPRFTMLETIREYAAERLEASLEADELRARHARYFLALAHLDDAGEAALLHRLDPELDNLRTALAWSCRNGQGAIALPLAVSLQPYWYARGLLHEGQLSLAHALEAGAGEPVRLRARALRHASRFADMQGEAAEAKRLAAESLRLSRDTGDRLGIAASVRALGMVALAGGDYQGAQALFQEGRARSSACGDRSGVARGVQSLGYLAVLRGDYDAARKLCDEAIILCRALGNDLSLTAALENRATVALGQRRPDEAASLLDESISLSRDLADATGMTSCLAGFAALNAARGAAESAARLLGAGEALRAELRYPLEPVELRLHEQTVAALRRELGEERLAPLQAEGRRMTLDAAVELALSTVR
jgi:predicted ATPase/DNA-binding SARP family transcriptional activator